MAQQIGAERRIRFIIAQGAPGVAHVASPATITGDDRAVYSYGKCIARKFDGEWVAVGLARGFSRRGPWNGGHRSNDTGSPTTNRHIRAALAVLPWSQKVPYAFDLTAGDSFAEIMARGMARLLHIGVRCVDGRWSLDDGNRGTVGGPYMDEYRATDVDVIDGGA